MATDDDKTREGEEQPEGGEANGDDTSAEGSSRASSEASEADDRSDAEGGEPSNAEAGSDASGNGDDSDDSDGAPAAAQLGATRYVIAGFFVTGIATAYVIGRTFSTIWGKLAEATWFQRSAAALSRVGEEERSEYSTAIGAIIALIGVIYLYRRADVKLWTEEVSSELSKVSWPSKDEVTNSTIIVIVTSAFATIYLALLDRFWGFVTNLVYGSLAPQATTQTSP